MKYENYSKRIGQLIEQGNAAVASGEHDVALMIFAEILETARKHGPDAMRGRRRISEADAVELARESAPLLQGLQQIGPRKSWQ